MSKECNCIGHMCGYCTGLIKRDGTHKETITIDVPDGYTCTGYRVPLRGEHYLNSKGVVALAYLDITIPWPILKKQHKEPEMFYRLADSCGWRQVVHIPALSFVRLGTYFFNEIEWDLMEYKDKGHTDLYLGYWNDGLGVGE